MKKGAAGGVSPLRGGKLVASKLAAVSTGFIALVFPVGRSAELASVIMEAAAVGLREASSERRAEEMACKAC